MFILHLINVQKFLIVNNENGNVQYYQKCVHIYSLGKIKGG